MFFREPSFLYLLGFLPLLLLLIIIDVYYRRKEERSFASVLMLNRLKREASKKRILWRSFFIILSIICFIIALARPAVRKESSTNKKSSLEGFEAMVCIDVSNSMLSQDVSPSRIDFAKKIVEKLLANLAGNKVGVIVFAGNSYIYTPITTDLSSAQTMLQGVSPDMLSEQGTNIAQAIALSLRSFSSKKDVGKAIIIITDGENQQEDALSAAKEAQKDGAKIAVVGIGSTQGGLIPISKSDFLRDQNGKPVVTKFNKDMCLGLAQAGKGIFISDSNPSKVVKGVLDFLNTLPKTSLNGASNSDYEEIYYLFLILSLMFMGIEFFILPRKNRFFKTHKLF